jgi:hypothetical protein
VDIPVTVNEEVPELLVIAGVVPDMVRAPIVSPVWRSKVPLVIVTTPVVAPVVPPLAIRKVPAEIVVPPV